MVRYNNLKCLRRESNPHRRFGRQDFKSCVSTSSTTKAILINKSLAEPYTNI